MKLIIISTLVLSVTSTTIISSINDEPNRRFSTSVVHGDPKYPDQQAQSSIDFHMDTSNFKSPSSQAIVSSGFQYTTPNSVKDYQENVEYTQQPYYGQTAESHKRYVNQHELQSDASPQTFYRSLSNNGYENNFAQIQPSNDLSVQKPRYGSSQSFNVGYSVKFAGNPANDRKVFKAPRVESDIITGSRKEEVVRPPINFDEINSGAFIETKKQKLSGIKPKYTKSVAFNPKETLIHAHITPQTQQHLSVLEKVPGTSKFQQEIEQKVQASFNHNSSPWQNLSPSVEIYKSREVDFPGQKFSSTNFDHAKALGKSEGFDYTNAVEFNSQMPQTQHYQTNLPKKKSIQYTQPEQPQALPVYAQQKFPIDVSLMRDPVLTMQKQPVNAEQIPIHFDTTLIQQIGKQYTGLLDENQGNYHIKLDNKGVKSPLNFQQFNTLLADQSGNKDVYAEIPKNDQNDLKFNFPQNALFNPALRDFKKVENDQEMYKVNENVQDKPQPHQTQFKVFSKPQNGFMRHEFERYKKSRTDSFGHPRQARINPKRLVRDFRIDTDLKPPPMYAFKHRRIHVGK